MLYLPCGHCQSAVFAQVLARYIFEVALHWTEETAAIAMVWAVYMGASLCVRERFHIRIMVAVQALPVKFGRIFVLHGRHPLGGFFCIFMLRVSWDYLYVFWRFPEVSPSLGINQFYPQTILVFGYGLMLIRLIQTYVTWMAGRGRGVAGHAGRGMGPTSPMMRSIRYEPARHYRRSPLSFWWSWASRCSWRSV